jgi:hypothetical protein
MLRLYRHHLKIRLQRKNDILQPLHHHLQMIQMWLYRRPHHQLQQGSQQKVLKD